MKNSNTSVVLYIIWLAILVLIPFVFMIVLSFSSMQGLDFSSISFSLQNFKNLVNPIYFEAYQNSIILSGISSLLCLLIGFPISYGLFRLKNKRLRNILFALFILPLWSNMLLRIMGWEIFFSSNSILNKFGISIDLIGNPIAIVIGMLSIYLPLMIFPIYTSLTKIDKSLIEASSDLGASSFQTFKKVIWPLSIPGVYSGFTMTFLPSATNFALPERLSGGRITLIGNLINSNFGKSFNYTFGSLLSVILIVIVLIMMVGIMKTDKDGDLLL